ncbi:MAG TPA: tetratricopeptide repeat protein [Bryobacteraceae bacterium]
MELSRIDLLKHLLEQDPSSTLARYGLAMEYKNAGHLESAVAEFERVLSANPAYSAAYFHGGQTLEKLGRVDEARLWYGRGVDRTPDPHARAELQAALDILGD